MACHPSLLSSDDTGRMCGQNFLCEVRRLTVALLREGGISSSEADEGGRDLASTRREQYLHCRIVEGFEGGVLEEGDDSAVTLEAEAE